MIRKTLYLFGKFALFIKMDAYTLSGFEKLLLPHRVMPYATQRVTGLWPALRYTLIQKSK